MYRAIDCNTWDDPWFSELDPSAKLLFLYLITNRRSTPCGAFEITLRAASFETGIPRTQLDDLLKALAPRVVWYPEHNAIWLRNFYKHQKCNENYRKGAANAAANMPESVRVAIYQTYPELLPGIAQPHETVDALPEPTKGAGEPLPNRSEPLPNRMQTGGKEEEKSREEKRIEEEQDAPNGAAALPPPAKAKPAKTAVSEEVLRIGQETVALYQDRYKAKYGKWCEIIQGDGNALRDVRKNLGLERYLQSLTRFFASTNENILRRRHPIKAFCNEINIWTDDQATAEHGKPFSSSRTSPPVIGGTLANPDFVQASHRPGVKLILGERAIRERAEAQNYGH